MSRKKPIEEIWAGWDDYDRPKDGQLYEHYRGGLYEVVTTGFLEETETPCVMYRSLENKTVWVRTAKNFLENVKYNGKTRLRFTPLKHKN